MYGSRARDVEERSDDVEHERAYAAALASSKERGPPDGRYLREDCGGVPAWEVHMFVDPAPCEPLTPTQEESLMQMAASARAAGQQWRAITLAEGAPLDAPLDPEGLSMLSTKPSTAQRPMATANLTPSGPPSTMSMRSRHAAPRDGSSDASSGLTLW